MLFCLSLTKERLNKLRAYNQVLFIIVFLRLMYFSWKVTVVVLTLRLLLFNKLLSVAFF